MDLNAETALRPTPSGYLQSPRYDRISVELKEEFLKHYKETGDLGESARLIGVDSRVIRWHRANDAVFGEAVRAITDDITDQAEGVVRKNMLRPAGVIDRMAWLRAKRPEIWNPERRMQVDVNVSNVAPILDKANAYEAELVANPPVPPPSTEKPPTP